MKKVLVFIVLFLLVGCHTYIIRDDQVSNGEHDSNLSSKLKGNGWRENSCDSNNEDKYKTLLCASKEFDKSCKALFLFPYNCPKKITVTIYRAKQDPSSLKYSIFAIGGYPFRQDEKIGDIASAEIKSILSGK